METLQQLASWVADFIWTLGAFVKGRRGNTDYRPQQMGAIAVFRGMPELTGRRRQYLATLWSI